MAGPQARGCLKNDREPPIGWLVGAYLSGRRRGGRTEPSARRRRGCFSFLLLAALALILLLLLRSGCG